MAVVSISRIQIRRGKKNSETGLPQLASGEFGWAIDTQELFIGNGSVSEGAPYVGNTKILTETDNIFDLANTYSYKIKEGFIQTGDTVTTPITRSLQERLDDTVSLRSFGANGDNTDHTDILQRAIDQLFLNPANVSNPKSRVTLIVEPGSYNINSTIYLPPYTTIKGAGSEKTIFNFSGSGKIFQTVNGLSTSGAPAPDAVSDSNNQAREISLSGFTINGSDSDKFLSLESCRDSVFEDIKIVGTRALGESVNSDNVAINLTSLSSIVTCKNNIFKKIRIKNVSYGIYSDYDIVENKWINCEFVEINQAISFGSSSIIGVSGQLTGPKNNLIEHCYFNDVEKQAIKIVKGTGNTSHSNRFYRCGNDGGTSLNPVTPVIEFDDFGNISNTDWFERTNDLSVDPTFFNVPYIPEVKGSVIYENSYTSDITVTESSSEFVRLIKFPADTVKSIEVDYIYKSNQVNAVRQGTIKITVDPENDTNTLTDDYEYIGDTQYAESIRFTAQNYNLSGIIVDTIALMMLNSISQDNGIIYFKVKTKS